MKINIGKAGGKKYLHVLTHEVKSTASFGFCEPILSREMIAQDSIDLRVGQTVYLAPMPRPTFGRIFVKTYHAFVPAVDLWHAYEQMLSGQAYHGSNTLYHPSNVPEIGQSLFSALLMYGSNIKIFEITAGYSIDSTGSSFSYTSLGHVATADQSTVYPLLLNGITTVGNGLNFSNTATTNRLFLLGHYIEYPAASDIPTDPVESDWVMQFNSSDGSKHYVAFGNYSYASRNIRKVLLGCGYQLNDSTDTLSLLPIFAYYKVWFDLMMPARNKTWKETNAFSFLERVEQENQSVYTTWLNDSQTKDRFLDFFVDLHLCYYTQNPDFVSAHITGASLPIAGTNATSVLGAQGSGTIAIQQNGSQYQPYIASSSSITQNALDMLKQVYHYVNAKTAIGGRVKEFFRSVYDATSLDDVESNFIGSQSWFIDPTAQFSTADTAGAVLGELGGKGLGSSAGQEFHYIAKQQGFLVSFIAFVPEARYAQAVDPLLRHKTKYDFYMQNFDSLTLLPTPKYCIYGHKEIFMPGNVSPAEDYAGGFGNIPNFMEYKIAYNRLNGNISLGSTRNAFLPYTLDKLLPFSVRKTSATNSKSYANVSASLLVASDYWRWIGRNAFLGWFNRIFYNSGAGYLRTDVPAVDDNFIIYNYLDFKVHSFALPTADSWQTDGFGEHISVEKA